MANQSNAAGSILLDLDSKSAAVLKKELSKELDSLSKEVSSGFYTKLSIQNKQSLDELKGFLSDFTKEMESTAGALQTISFMGNVKQEVEESIKELAAMDTAMQTLMENCDETTDSLSDQFQKAGEYISKYSEDCQQSISSIVSALQSLNNLSVTIPLSESNAQFTDLSNHAMAASISINMLEQQIQMLAASPVDLSQLVFGLNEAFGSNLTNKLSNTLAACQSMINNFQSNISFNNEVAGINNDAMTFINNSNANQGLSSESPNADPMQSVVSKIQDFSEKFVQALEAYNFLRDPSLENLPEDEQNCNCDHSSSGGGSPASGGFDNPGDNSIFNYVGERRPLPAVCFPFRICPPCTSRDAQRESSITINKVQGFRYGFSF